MANKVLVGIVMGSGSDLETMQEAKGTEEEKLVVFRKVRDEIKNNIGAFIN